MLAIGTNIGNCLNTGLECHVLGCSTDSDWRSKDLEGDLITDVPNRYAVLNVTNRFLIIVAHLMLFFVPKSHRGWTVFGILIWIITVRLSGIVLTYSLHYGPYLSLIHI
eukprot:TRINITY_DN3627_c0_g1_i3.p2 TRINITY_DN3627_c0_g1~~TRINITY_DN3627_c0_g1_i3.p2  ORF type:complete len:109 (-),score=19.71 TRINITY_DN3627_c0_g1_i3:132-458(-)